MPLFLFVACRCLLCLSRTKAKERKRKTFFTIIKKKAFVGVGVGLEEEVIYRVCSGELDTIPLQDLQGLLMMPMKIQKEDGVVALGVFTDVGESGKRKRKEKKGEGAMLVGHHRPDLLRDETRKEEGRLVSSSSFFSFLLLVRKSDQKESETEVVTAFCRS